MYNPEPKWKQGKFKWVSKLNFFIFQKKYTNIDLTPKPAYTTQQNYLSTKVKKKEESKSPITQEEEHLLLTTLLVLQLF